MNQYVMYKSQTNFEQELLRLKASALPAKAKAQDIKQLLRYLLLRREFQHGRRG